MMKYLSVMFVILVMTGCASQGGTRIDQETIAVEKLHSSTGKIGVVTINRSETGLRVSGSVIRRFGGRGPIAGYVHIEALGYDGQILSANDTDYRRMSVKARSAIFFVDINIDPASVKRMRISHQTHKHEHPDG